MILAAARRIVAEVRVGRKGPTGAGVLALAALPWALLVVKPQWIYSPPGIDPWLYFGYYLDLGEHLRAFDGTYYSTRLTALLPGWLAHKLFGAVVANAVLHLGLYYVSVFSLYASLVRVVSRRAAFLASALMGSHCFFLNAVGWDYVDGFGITYFLLAVWMLGSANRSRWWPAWLAGAGAALAAMAVANIAYLVLLPFPILVYAAENRARRPYPLWLGCLTGAAGMVALVGGLCVVSQQVAGRFWFFLPSFTWTQSFLQQTGESPWLLPPEVWGPRALWLVVPFCATAGAAVALAARRADGPDPVVRWGYHLQLIGLVAAFTVVEARRQVCPLQFSHYASLLIPAAFLSLGVMIDRAVRGMGRWTFAGVAAGGLAVLVLGLDGWAFRLTEALDAAPVVVPGACGLLAVGWLAATRRAAVGGVVALFVGLMAVNGQYVGGLIGSLKGLDYNEEQAVFLGPHRKDLYLATADAAQAVRSAGGKGDAWFWFDQAEPRSVAYVCAASTHTYGFRLVGTKFPDLTGTPEYVTARLTQGGAKVVVLSRDPAAADKAVTALAGIGVEAKPYWHQPIRRGVVEYELTVLDVGPLRRPRELVPDGVVWSGLEGSNGTAIEGRPPAVRFATPAPPWSYAATVPVTRPDGPGAVVVVKLVVEAGAVGVGILDRNGKDVYAERSVRADPGAEQTVELVLPAAATADRVVFRTGAQPGSAVVAVRDVSLYRAAR